VSDPTLLEILSLGSDPPSVVPHFQSGLFDSLTAVTFDKVDKTRMLEMFSQQGEKVCACPCCCASRPVRTGQLTVCPSRLGAGSLPYSDHCVPPPSLVLTPPCAFLGQ
jgi:hypothetical protein